MTVEISELELMDEKGDVVDFDFLPFESTHRSKAKTHIIRGEENDALWMEGMNAQDVVDAARLIGAEVTALCGYTWVPKHDPTKHDICDECLKIWDSLG